MTEIEGYTVSCESSFDEGSSIVFPVLKIVFGMGRPLPALYTEEELLIIISNMHPNYISGLFKYVQHREEDGKPSPTIVVPKDVKARLSRMFDALRGDDASYNITLVDVAIGEDFHLGERHILRPFKTSDTHGQGYIVYSLENQLKQEYATLSENDLKDLELSGVETTYAVLSPVLAFPGRTTSEFFDYPENADVFRAKILCLEATDPIHMNSMENTRSKRGIPLSEIENRQHQFENRALLFYNWPDYCDDEDVKTGISDLPPHLVQRAWAFSRGTLITSFSRGA